MPRETPSPVDLPDQPIEAPGLGWAALTIAVATIFLLAFNAVSLRDWANDLTPSPTQARIAAAAENWLALTDRTGLSSARAWLHDRWKGIENARFAPDPSQGNPPEEAS